jgi:hypothetical protein
MSQPQPKPVTPIAPAPARPPSRMTLAGVIRGKKQRPVRVLLYGVEGVGKSTFAASAPKPIFLGAEDGTDQLDVERFESPATWQDVLDAIQVLTVEPSEYQTLVIDTLDWAEPLLWAHICKRDEQPNIEAYGYGKGYAAALDEWRVFLAALERLRKAKSMHLVMLAHSWIKPFKNPEGDDFDRYELKLHPKASGLLKEWTDAVLFAAFETFANKDKKTKRVRGVSTGARIIYTSRTAAYDAKNRYGLPDTVPLSWSDFMASAESHQTADPSALREEIARKAKELGGELEKNTLASLERVGTDSAKLAQLNSWVNAKLIEKEG